METQQIATVVMYSIFFSIVLGLSITCAHAEDIQIAKSEDVYVAPEDHGKEKFNDIYAAHSESILEDGRLFLQVNFASYHPDTSSEDDFNEFNPGLGLEYHFDNYFLAGGFFENSIDKFSTYWGVGHERIIGADWLGSASLGELLQVMTVAFRHV
jgi:hypothetical protein